MAISADVLYSAVVDLAPGYTDQFTVWSPAMEAMVKRGNKEVLQSYQKEFVVAQQGPGQATNLITGNEILPGGRNTVGQRGNEPSPTIIYTFDVPGKDLDEADGEYDLARLIKNYPELAMADFHERIAQQLVMGNGVGAGGFITWNGDTTYNPQGFTRDGVFSFAAPAAQTSTVFGLVKSGGVGGVTGWHNHYADISSFGFNGEQVLRDTYNLASRQGADKVFGRVDHMFADSGTYSNYLEGLREPVRFLPPANQKGDPSSPNVRTGVPFLDSMMWLEDKIDPAAFSTAAAQDGVVYGINTATWHMFLQGKGGITGNKGFFTIKPPMRIPTQYMWRFEIIFSMGMYCQSLRSNFVVTGGATP